MEYLTRGRPVFHLAHPQASQAHGRLWECKTWWEGRSLHQQFYAVPWDAASGVQLSSVMPLLGGTLPTPELSADPDLRHSRCWNPPRWRRRVLLSRRTCAVQLGDLYENDCIFDKFDCCFSGDGSHVATGTYSNSFRVISRGDAGAAAPASDIALEASRDPQRKRFQQTPSKACCPHQPPPFSASSPCKALYSSWR